MLKIDEMATQKVSIFDVFWQNCQNASLIYLPNLTALYIQLDLGTRIPNLQSESKNVENWRNGDLKSVDFLCFVGFSHQNGQYTASIYLLICLVLSFWINYKSLDDKTFIRTQIYWKTVELWSIQFGYTSTKSSCMLTSL